MSEATCTEWGVKWERPGGMHIDEGLDEKSARHDAGWAVPEGCSVKLVRRKVTYGEWEEVAPGLG